jgi:hypothetical protein
MAQTTPADIPPVEHKEPEHHAPQKPAVNDADVAKQGAQSKLHQEVGLKAKGDHHTDDAAESHDLLRSSTPGHDGNIPNAANANQTARRIDDMSSVGGVGRVRSDTASVTTDGATMSVKGHDYTVGTGPDGKSQIYFVGQTRR